MRRLLLLLALAGPTLAMALWSPPVAGQAVGQAVAQAGPTLAVAPFANQTGDAAYDALGLGLADMLLTDLSAVEQLTLVERSRLQALLDELALAEGGFIDPATAATLGRGLGARYVLVGAITAVAPQLRLDARVIDVQSGELVHAAQASGPTEEFFLLEKELAGGLADGLGVALSARERARLGRVQTESFAAFSAYSSALSALDRGQLEVARDQLEAALQADERFGLATAALADAQARLEAAGATGREVRSEAARRVLAGLRALPTGGKADPAAVGALVHPRAWQAQLPLDARDLLAVSGAVLELGLPDDAVLDLQITTMALNEWALANHTLAAMYLKRRSDVLTYGQALLDRYPMTSWAASVQAQLQAVIDELQKIEAGRAALPQLRQQARLTEALWTCTAEGRPAVLLPACAQAWTVAADLPAAVRAEVAVDVVQGSIHAGDLDRAREVGAQVEALAGQEGVERHLNRVRSELAGLERNLADIEERRPGLASASDGGRHAVLAQRLAAVGQHAEAAATVAEGLSRFPGDARLLETRVELAVIVHDQAAADAAFAAWSAGGEPVNSRVASAWRRLPEDLADARRGRAKALADLAQDLASRGLYDEAGDAWLALAREERAHDTRTEDVLLTQAGFHYSQGGGKLSEARALFEEVVARFPGTQSAETARLYLGTVPR